MNYYEMDNFTTFLTVTVVSFGIVLLSDFISSRTLRSIVKSLGYLILLALAISPFIGVGFIDPTAALFAILAALVGLSVGLYVDSYEVLKYKVRNLRLLIDLFSLSMFATFISPNLVSFIMFWLFAEIVGFFAIVFEVHRRTLAAGLRYLVVSMVPADIALIALVALSSIRLGFEEAFLLPVSRIGEVLGNLGPALSTIIALGFMAKAAIAPLHFWLPDAHSLAPAPASALLSGVMVKMGIYGLLRVLPSLNNLTLYIIVAFSAITAVYGGIQALVQNDIKRLLAYSTIENTGLIALALAVHGVFGTKTLLTASLFLVIAHGLFKAALFLDSGIVEIAAHTRELPRLGHLSRVLSLPSISSLNSVLSLIGVPPTLGFLAKLYLFAGFIEVAYLAPTIGIALLAATVLGVALAIGYGVRYLTIYWGSLERPSEVVELRDKPLILSEFFLACLNIVLSIPIYVLLGILGYTPIGIMYLAPFALLKVIFVILLYYVYTHVKAFRTDKHWLGGAVP